MSIHSESMRIRSERMANRRKSATNRGPKQADQIRRIDTERDLMQVGISSGEYDTMSDSAWCRFLDEQAGMVAGDKESQV